MGMNLLKKAITWSADQYRKHPSNFLNVTTAATFSILSLGEAVAISSNKNIPDEQKKFMVPQALCEGLINVAVILGVSTSLSKVGSKLVKEAKIVPKHIPDSLKNKETLGEILKFEKFKEIAPKNIKGLNEQTFNKIKAFHDGAATVTGSLIGLLFAQNVLNPILTNKFAQWFKKRRENTADTKLDIKESPIIPAIRLYDDMRMPPTFSAFVKRTSNTTSYTYISKPNLFCPLKK